MHLIAGIIIGKNQFAFQLTFSFDKNPGKTCYVLPVVGRDFLCFFRKGFFIKYLFKLILGVTFYHA